MGQAKEFLLLTLFGRVQEQSIMEGDIPDFLTFIGNKVSFHSNPYISGLVVRRHLWRHHHG